jgi:hypothetical protein
VRVSTRAGSAVRHQRRLPGCFDSKENSMTMQMMVVSQVKPSPHNLRNHSDKQIRQIANSIAAFGFMSPCLVNEKGELIAGHGRYLAAKLLDLAKIPVIVVAGLSLTKQRALAIADNKIAENAGWDRERLAIEIPELTELLSADPIINGPLSQPALRGM